MPTRDEDGNLIGLDAFPIGLRGDDGVEWIVPGTPMPETVVTSNPEEHDCLPPLEAPPEMTWTLSNRSAKKLCKMVKRLENGEKRRIRSARRYKEKLRRAKLKGCLYEYVMRTITQQFERDARRVFRWISTGRRT